MKDYKALVREFPLVLLGDLVHYRQALKLSTKLRKANLAHQRDYLFVLVLLILEYEKIHNIKILRDLMSETKMSGNEFSKFTEINRPDISRLLTGNQKITKGQATKIIKCFNISDSTFLGV